MCRARTKAWTANPIMSADRAVATKNQKRLPSSIPIRRYLWMAGRKNIKPNTKKTNPMTWFQMMRAGFTTCGTTCFANFCALGATVFATFWASRRVTTPLC